MPRLLILRHAAAEPLRTGEADHDRPLSQRGRRQAADVAVVLRDRGEAVDRVLCSPALRTRQTLEIIAGALDVALPPLFDEALYDAGGDHLALLRAHGQDAEALLLIGHNPAAQVTALRLDDGHGSAPGMGLSQGFPPAALAVFDGDRRWPEVGEGTMRLTAFITPGA